MRSLYIIIILLLSIQLNAQTWQEVIELLPATSYSNDVFGFEVDIDVNIAVVGAPNHNLDSNDSNDIMDAGAVYVYEKDSNGDWNQIQKLVATIRSNNEKFGAVVAVSGDYIVVGPQNSSTDELGDNFLVLSGAAYVFERNTSGSFVQVQKLVASDREIGAQFGRDFDIEGETIVIGAFGEDKDENGINPLGSPGAAYVFERATNGTWSETQKLVASARSDGDAFGSAVAIDNNNLVIGAHLDDDDALEQNPITDAGSVYVFTKQTNGQWTEMAKISASDRAFEDEFGDCIDIDGDYLVVGSKFQDENIDNTDNLEDAGAAYIFEKNMSGEWVQLQKLVGSNRDASDWYGETVSISGDYIVIGAKREDNDSANDNFNSGAVYTYKRDTNLWLEEQILRASNIEGNAIFGNGLSLQNESLIIGSVIKTVNGITSAGSSYIFELDDGLSVSEQSLTNILVYPNPTTGEFVIALTQPKDLHIRVLTNLGQIVIDKFHQSSPILKLNIDGASGLYFLELTAQDGASRVLKLLKQ